MIITRQPTMLVDDIVDASPWNLDASIPGPQRLNPTDFGHLLTFLPDPCKVHICEFWWKHLNSYRMDYHEIWLG